ncbi:CDP-glycerol glycerophosphotransferase family protein [Candidatus Woesearchaeota archaeon]|nr:CDP-glycerol glycerophosphotransferase family protein [Candidatus Woesearchaeota archaeon]
MARYVIGRIRKWLGLVNTIRSDVLFLSNTRFSRVREDENVMFGTLMKELRRLGVSTKTVNYALLHKLEFLKDFVKRFMFIKTNYIGDYYSLATLRANKRLFSKYKRLWKEIRNAAELKKSFVYREIDVFEFAQPLFDLIFDSLSYLSVDNLNITKKMLEKEKPKVFVLDHEDNFYGKGLMMNAKNKRINSLALQHEAIIPEDCNHSHIKDKSALDKNSVFWRPLPDKKCVWAVYSRRILMDLCNYSADRIVVTGNPMFDDLVSEKFNKSQLLQKYSLPADTKLVLYATEGYKRDPELFLDGIKSMKNALFIIKPHPSEDANLYLLLQKKYRLKNLVLLPKSANFHELIAISDVLVTKTSAAGIEAMIKKIPVVIFNPDDVFNPWKYVQSGAAVNAKNCTELKKQITMLLTDSRLRKKLSAQASKFVYNVAYKQDGNATRRVAKVIMQLLDK